MTDKTDDIFDELEDYHKKSKEKVEEQDQEQPRKVYKKEDKKMDKEGKEVVIRFRIKPILIERIIYIAVILILAFSLFFFGFLKPLSKCPFSGLGSIVGLSGSGVEGNESAVIEDAVNETEDTEETTTEDTTTTTTTSSSGVIKAELAFTSDNIGISGEHPNVKVKSISYKIRNSGDDLYSRVDIYWYDKDDEATIKTKLRASYKLKVSAGKVSPLKTITSFSGSYLSSINKQETFVLKLYDDKTNKLLNTATVEFNPP